jgi:hypothetical protein
MEGYERNNKEEIHKELQDLDPLCSPHLEERWIGGNIDLDLLSLFPQKYARIMGGTEEEGKLSISTTEERESQKHGWLKGEEGVFIGGENMAVGSSSKRRSAVSPATPKFRPDCPAIAKKLLSNMVQRAAGFSGLGPNFSGLGPNFPPRKISTRKH